MEATRIHVDHILCPTDFSAFSSRALERAIALAQRFEARLRILHVVPFDVPVAGPLPHVSPSTLANPEARRQVEEEMSAFAAPAFDAGVPTQVELREGDPGRQIHVAAQELPAGLVVMATRGRTRLEHLLLGSVTENVLSHSPCPVLTVCHEERRAQRSPGLPSRVLCATDFSERSAATVSFAFGLAEESQAQITLLHVIDGLGDIGADPCFAAPEVAAWRNDLELQALALLREAVPEGARVWCRVEERVTVGRAPKEILRMAAELQADLIVMGTHGRGPLGRALLGSTSSHVVREARCPVLTVRPRRAVEQHEAVESLVATPLSM